MDNCVCVLCMLSVQKYSAKPRVANTKDKERDQELQEPKAKRVEAQLLQKMLSFKSYLKTD